MFKQLQRNYIYFLAAVLLAAIFCFPISAPPVEQTGWILYAEDIGFQPQPQAWVLLSATSGAFNSSVNRLSFSLGGGSYFVYTSNETMTFTVSYGGLTNVKVKGDQGNAIRGVANNTSIDVDALDMVGVYWSVGIVAWVPINFILGMFGLVALGIGPYMAIKRIQKGSYQEGLVIGVVVVALGIAFVLVWLWS